MPAPDARTLQPYAPRKIASLGLWAALDWRLKAYGVHHDPEAAPEGLIAPAMAKGARSFVRSHLSIPDVEGEHYRLGFVIIHQGAQQNWLVWNWWAFDNICSHLLATSAPETPGAFEIYGGRAMACVWELEIIAFERRAWIEAVLSGPRRFDAYMDRAFPDGLY